MIKISRAYDADILMMLAARPPFEVNLFFELMAKDVYRNFTEQATNEVIAVGISNKSVLQLEFTFLFMTFREFEELGDIPPDSYITLTDDFLDEITNQYA